MKIYTKFKPKIAKWIIDALSFENKNDQEIKEFKILINNLYCLNK